MRDLLAVLFRKCLGTFAGGLPVRDAGLSGHDTRSSSDPGVLVTRSELEDLAQLIDGWGTYSARRLSQLSAQVAGDPASAKECGVQLTLQHRGANLWLCV